MRFVSKSRLLILTAAVAFALPAQAAAADRLVDKDTGADVGDCSVSPCQTIGYGIGQALAGERILVDDTATDYVESNLQIGDGRSLVGSNIVTADSGPTVIDPGPSATPTVVVGATGASEVSGLTLRNASVEALRVDGTVSVSGNNFDESSAIQRQLFVNTGAISPRILGNTFSDGPGLVERGIVTASTATPQISGNTLTGFHVAIEATAGTPLIDSNNISGITTAGGSPYAGIRASEANPTILSNLIHDPVPGDNPAGIQLEETGGGNNTGATMRFNRILGQHLVGVSIFKTEGSVTMFGDTIAGYLAVGDGGIDSDGQGSATAGNFSASNVTVANAAPGSTADIALNSANASLDSTIVGDLGIQASGGDICTIAFSRGPTTAGTSCQIFQTTSNPMFVNPAGDDYHLSPGSPMIDAGNPAAPVAPNDLDLDSNPRSLDGTPTCSGPSVAIRDIGADELVAGPADCLAPDTTVSGKAKVKAKKKRVRISFTLGSEPGVSFECSLDGAAFAPCTSPFSAKVKKGTHTLRARATDAVGNQDATPGSFTTKVKRKKPKPR